MYTNDDSTVTTGQSWFLSSSSSVLSTSQATTQKGINIVHCLIYCCVLLVGWSCIDYWYLFYCDNDNYHDDKNVNNKKWSLSLGMYT